MTHWRPNFKRNSLLFEWKHIFESKITTKYLLDFCWGSTMLLIFKAELEALLSVIFMYTVLLTLRVSWFHWNHFNSPATSFASSRSEHWRSMIEVSSAKMKASDEKHTLGRSMIYMWKRSGPSFEPCTTPQLIFLLSDWTPFMSTYWKRLEI